MTVTSKLPSKDRKKQGDRKETENRLRAPNETVEITDSFRLNSIWRECAIRKQVVPIIPRSTWPWGESPCCKDGVDLLPVQDPRQDQHRR